jgi:uncharacterized protein YgfB (UPF0149 family)
MIDLTLVQSLDDLIEILQDRANIEAKTGLDPDEQLLQEIDSLIQMKEYIEKMNLVLLKHKNANHNENSKKTKTSET